MRRGVTQEVHHTSTSMLHLPHVESAGHAERAPGVEDWVLGMVYPDIDIDAARMKSKRTHLAARTHLRPPWLQPSRARPTSSTWGCMERPRCGLCRLQQLASAEPPAQHHRRHARGPATSVNQRSGAEVQRGNYESSCAVGSLSLVSLCSQQAVSCPQAGHSARYGSGRCGREEVSSIAHWRLCLMPCSKVMLPWLPSCP